MKMKKAYKMLWISYVYRKEKTKRYTKYLQISLRKLILTGNMIYVTDVSIKK